MIIKRIEFAPCNPMVVVFLLVRFVLPQIANCGKVRAKNVIVIGNSNQSNKNKISVAGIGVCGF